MDEVRLTECAKRIRTKKMEMVRYMRRGQKILQEMESDFLEELQKDPKPYLMHDHYVQGHKLRFVRKHLNWRSFSDRAECDRCKHFEFMPIPRWTWFLPKIDRKALEYKFQQYLTQEVYENMYSQYLPHVSSLRNSAFKVLPEYWLLLRHLY